MNIPPFNPANGERNAMIGYVPQYKVAADLIYNALLDGTFEWVKIADPEAGRVDDIQIATAGQLDAYQVKWAETIKYITFKELISDGKKAGKHKPNLMRQLAEGWQQLKILYQNLQIRVHLISRYVPSPTKEIIPLDESPPLVPHFQGFLSDCWRDKSWVGKGLSAIPKGWRSAMSKLQTATCLDDGDFIHFVKDCSLQFQYQLPTQNGSPNSEEARRVDDTKQIFTLLLRIAGGERRIVEITRAELLQHLHWENRFKPLFRHEFQVDEKLYQPIKMTISELESSLNHHKQGYLALIGTPGSGKSTTLTQFLRYRKGFRVIRYYAFVRDDTRLGRGEAVSFLHDIVLALKNHGIHGQKISFPQSREELLEKLSSQLLELSERWKKDSVKTLILVDGLDHIEREQSPERSLLKDLPLPESLPDGVVFILGSQKTSLDGLSPRIQAHLEENGRTITIQLLDKASVFSLIDSATFKTTLSYDQKETILRLSDGHPLALNYLVQKLQTVSNNNEIDDILNSTDPYKGHIELDYKVYWKKFETDQEIRNLLALISRLRGAVDLKEVVSWVGEPVVTRFISQAQHYFRKETDTRWHFFHNSFRQFLLAGTSRNIFGSQDTGQHRKYHRQLADYATKAGDGTAWKWEEIYHRASAGDGMAVIALGSQENLRKQFYALRPLEDILDDITLCLQAAREELDGLAVVRALLIETELREREDKIKEADIPRLLIEISGVDAAIGYVIRRRELRISATEALKFCKLLIRKGFMEESKIIFDTAEPLSKLSGSDRVEFMDLDELKAWASIAHCFRSLENIIKAIDKLQANTERSFNFRTSEEANREIRYSVLMALANGIHESNDTQKTNMLRALLSEREDAGNIIFDLDYDICMNHRHSNDALPALERILEWADKEELGVEEKTLIAELLFRIKGDKKGAAEWIEGINQPPLHNDTSGSKWENLSPFVQRIRLNRLKSALGFPEEYSTAVPNIEDVQLKCAVLFERMLVILANLWGRSWRGDKINPEEIMNQIHPALVLFNKPCKERSERLFWSQYKGSAADYFNFMINAVAVHGTEAILALANAFEKQWVEQNTKHYWQTGWKRQISLYLHRAGCPAEVLKKNLSLVEQGMDIWDDLHQWVKDCAEQAFAWLKAGELERARALLPRMLETSFGIYHEDDNQFLRWVGWLKKVNLMRQEGTVERIRHFVAALVILERSNRGHGIQDAARGIMESVALWNPDYALELMAWLMEQKAIHYTAVLEGLITASLKSSNPTIEIIVSVICHLLIPFQRSSSQELASLFAERCVETFDKKRVIQLLQTILNALDTKSYPSVREDWLRGLVTGLSQSGVDAASIVEKLRQIPAKKDEGTDRPAVILSSGESLAESEVLLRVTCYDDLKTLLHSVTEVNSFRWDNVVSKIIDTLNYEEISDLRRQLGKIHSEPIALPLFASRLAVLGKKGEAMILVEQALKQTSPSGWNRQYDGGTRLNAVKCLTAVDPENGPNRAFKIFIDDYLSEARYPSVHLRNIDELLPFFFKQIPLLDVWDEIQQHIYQLSDFSREVEFPPSPSKAIAKKSHAEIQVHVLVSAFHIPVREIRLEAHKALCQLIAGQVADSLIRDCMKIHLFDNEMHQACALSILEAVASSRIDFIKYFPDEIYNLTASPNITVRQMAIGLVKLVNLQTKPIDKNRGYLPLTYKLEFPEMVMPDWNILLETIPEGQPYPDTDDPIELVRPFNPIFQRLSKLTNIPFQNLLIRATHLMKSLLPQNRWNKQAEKHMQDWLSAAELRFSFCRPRASVAFQALAHIVAELIDTGDLSDNAFSQILGDFIIHDPVLSLMEPVPRLVEIIGMKRDDTSPISEEAWVRDGNKALPLLLNEDNNGRIVLGELSRFTYFNWERPSEYRFSMVCHPDRPKIDNLQDAFGFFPYNNDWYAYNYPNLADARKYPSAVVYAIPRQVEIGNLEWLAINPAIPIRLGWQLDSDGLFRWVNAEGETMVESIRWQDGTIHRFETRYRETCSEGWLVVATKEAVVSISKIIGKAIRFGAIARQYKGRSDRELVRDVVFERKEWNL
ncbi:MAG: hypothetical protein HW390_383 [Candidatus Brocadiaceae bacterium]|nr:hypothetical protein [Candidatus Brocadiaceae bacterium]